MTRVLTYPFVAFLLAGLLLAHISLVRMSIGGLIICASSDDASRIPSPVCMHYLQNATDREDAAQLDAGAGLAYAFSIPDAGTRRTVMTRLLEIGVDIDKPSGVDGLTPLHAAILLNDSKLVEFLIEHGAGLQVTSVATAAPDPSSSDASRFPGDCDRWSLTAAQAETFFALSTELDASAYHREYENSRCMIAGELIEGGRHWEFRINGAAKGYWSDGTDTRYFGCTDAECDPLVLAPHIGMDP